MEHEHSHSQSDQDTTGQRERAIGGSELAGEIGNPPPGVAFTPGLLEHPDIGGRGNAPVRAEVLQRMQGTYGNRAVRRYLNRSPSTYSAARGAGEAQPAVQRDVSSGTAGGGTTATPNQPQANAPAVADPTENYVVPFDRNPLSLPGEQVLFNDVFNHADPTLFQLVFTGAGGKFDSASGAASKTIAGLNSGNLPFFIDSAWDGRTNVSVQLKVERLADHAAVRNYTWTFKKKTNVPTTMTQKETEGERDLPSSYSYKVGPDIGAAGGPDYEHVTILETFGSNSCNITMADLKPEFKAAHPEITNDAQITTYFFDGSGSNGTFTVDNTDQIYDQHGGGMPDKATFVGALITMKEIHVDLPQTYSAKSGTALGSYTIRRILKVDGSKKLKKMKT